jgi:hypothetical protein
MVNGWVSHNAEPLSVAAGWAGALSLLRDELQPAASITAVQSIIHQDIDLFICSFLYVIRKSAYKGTL